jgi:hypothetical protein
MGSATFTVPQGERLRRYDPASYVPLTAEVLQFLLAALGSQGLDDLDWSEAIEPPSNADDFAREIVFVICNSGMKNTVAAVVIFEKCMAALDAGLTVRQVFRHPGKSAAIDKVWAERAVLFEEFQLAPDQLAFLAALPWIGSVTKYHLAKNFGVDVAKPDVHLQRLADREGVTAQDLCTRLAAETALRVATVDTILWRACANGILDSRTGMIPSIQHLNDIRDLQECDRLDHARGLVSNECPVHNDKPREYDPAAGLSVLGPRS